MTLVIVIGIKHESLCFFSCVICSYAVECHRQYVHMMFSKAMIIDEHVIVYVIGMGIFGKSVYAVL